MLDFLDVSCMHDYCIILRVSVCFPIWQPSEYSISLTSSHSLYQIFYLGSDLFTAYKDFLVL